MLKLYKIASKGRKMAVQYYVEKADRGDVWKKVTNGSKVDWYKNGTMRLGGPDISKVEPSNSSGTPLSEIVGYQHYTPSAEDKRQAYALDLEEQMDAKLKKADKLKAGGLSTDSDNNEYKNYESAMIDYDKLRDSYKASGGSNPKYSYKNPSALTIAHGKDFDNDGTIDSKDADTDNDGVENSLDTDDFNKKIGVKKSNSASTGGSAGDGSNPQPVQKVDNNGKDDKKTKNKSGSSGADSGAKTTAPGLSNNGHRQSDAKKAADANGFLTRYGDAETAQKALYATIDAIAMAEPGAVREFGTRGTSGYYVELKTKDGWVSGSSNKAVSQLAKYAPSKEEAVALPALASAAAASAVQTNPVATGQLTGTQLAEKANFAAAKPLSADIDLGEAAKKSRAIIAAADMNSDGKLNKAETALYSPGDRNGNGKIGAKEASKFISAADTNKSGVISAEESKAYAVLDTNNNGKLGKKEFAAYKAIDANGDGDITNEEAQKAYSAKVVTNQDKRTRQLAKEFIDKNAAKSGAQAVDAQVAALAGVPVVATAQNPQAATPATPAVPAAPATDGSAATPAAPAVPASPAAVLAAADRNDNGKVGAGELAKFESIADADASGEVTTAEAQAFALIDSNENGKIGKKELAAFRAIDKNGDGNLTTKEAKAALKAQIDSVQDKRTHDLAKDYLAKNLGNGGGSDEVDAAAAALVNAGRTESSLKKEAAAAKKSKK